MSTHLGIETKKQNLNYRCIGNLRPTSGYYPHSYYAPYVYVFDLAIFLLLIAVFFE